MVTAIIHDQQPTVLSYTFSCYTRLRHEIQSTGLEDSAKWVLQLKISSQFNNSVVVVAFVRGTNIPVACGHDNAHTLQFNRRAVDPTRARVGAVY